MSGVIRSVNGIASLRRSVPKINLDGRGRPTFGEAGMRLKRGSKRRRVVGRIPLSKLPGTTKKNKAYTPHLDKLPRTTKRWT